MTESPSMTPTAVPGCEVYSAQCVSDCSQDSDSCLQSQPGGWGSYTCGGSVSYCSGGWAHDLLECCPATCHAAGHDISSAPCNAATAAPYTRPTAAPGWSLATTVGESCGATCSHLGLVCDPFGFALVTSAAYFSGNVQGADACSGGTAQGNSVATINPSKAYNTCYYGGGAGTCAATSTDAYRFCPCKSAPTGAPTVSPTAPTASPTTSPYTQGLAGSNM
eukprot:gene58125-biopygen29776